MWMMEPILFDVIIFDVVANLFIVTSLSSFSFFLCLKTVNEKEILAQTLPEILPCNLFASSNVLMNGKAL